MIDPRNLRKKIEVVNYEGVVLSSHVHPMQEKYFFGALSKHDSVRVFFEVSLVQINEYLLSNKTLNQLYDESSSLMIKTQRRRNEVKTYLKLDFKPNLILGDKLYNEISDDAKSIEFEEKFG